MKWLIVLFLITVFHVSNAQGKKTYDIKINYVLKELLLPLSPFNGFEKEKFCRLTITDTTMYLDSIKKIGEYKPRLPMIGDFIILNKSKDNLKFLVLSSWYDVFKMFNMRNGQVFMYVIDLSDKKMHIYIFGYYNETGSKHLDVDLDSIPYKPTLMEGDIKQVFGVEPLKRE